MDSLLHCKSDPVTRTFLRDVNPKNGFRDLYIHINLQNLVNLEGCEREYLHLMLQVTQNYQLEKVLVAGDECQPDGDILSQSG